MEIILIIGIFLTIFIMSFCISWHIIRNVLNYEKVEEEEITLDKAEEHDGWFLISDGNIPHEVLIVVCDTYDCGWTQDTAWWYDKENCWMSTGGVESSECHLPYTHWRYLGDDPKTDSDKLDEN